MSEDRTTAADEERIRTTNTTTRTVVVEANDGGCSICRGDPSAFLLVDHLAEERNQKSSFFLLPHSHSYSNESLLILAFLSFTGFALVQLVVALVVAGSEAMIGDSCAMMVDAVAYLFNFCAERQKTVLLNEYIVTNTNEESEYAPMVSNDVHEEEEIEQGNTPTSARQSSSLPPLPPQRSMSRKHMMLRKKFLQLELLSPILSVGMLLVITVLVVRRSVTTLLYPDPAARIPNLNLMLLFSAVNLLLDFVNVCCFAKAKPHWLQYTNTNTTTTNTSRIKPSGSESGSSLQGTTTTPTAAVTSQSPETEHGNDGAMDDDEEQPRPASSIGRSLLCTHHRHSALFHNHSNNNTSTTRQPFNLNMCSAFTHVFADTLRSVAVLGAAGLAKLIPSISPVTADATAAVCVSAIILLSIMPLLQGLIQNGKELWWMHQQEKRQQQQLLL
jgi:Co/Zn/Cd efflux system component